MPSPICKVNGGSTTNGVDIKPGSTATISLNTHTDVAYWNVECVSTDDLQSVATINATITVDHLAQTATVAIPPTARGCALIFKSTVNRGIDLHGVVQPSYSTTFAIFGLGTVGERLIANGQTTEGNQTFGWVEDLNKILSDDLNKNPDFGTNNISISGPVNCGSIITTDIAGYNSFNGYVCYSIREVDGTIFTEDHFDTLQNDFAVVVVDPVTHGMGYHFDFYLPFPTLGRMIMIINDTTDMVYVYGNASENVNYGSYFNINPININPIENRNYGATFVSDGTDWFLTHPYVAPAM